MSYSWDHPMSSPCSSSSEQNWVANSWKAHSKFTVWAHLVSSLWANWVSSKWTHCEIFNMNSLWAWCKLTSSVLHCVIFRWIYIKYEAFWSLESHSQWDYEHLNLEGLNLIFFNEKFPSKPKWKQTASKSGIFILMHGCSTYQSLSPHPCHT